MEEVGKYQSLQDRIKRLTKNQPNPQLPALPHDPVKSLAKINDGEQSQKQNLDRFTFSKKRQNSETNLRKIHINKEPTPNNDRVFQSISNLISENSNFDFKEPKNQIKKTSNNYAFRKPSRQPFEGPGKSTDLSYILRRNDSVQNMSEKYACRMLLTETEDLDYRKEKSGLFDSTQEGPVTRRMPSHGLKKSLTNMTYKPDYSEIGFRYSLADEKQPITKQPNIRQTQVNFSRNSTANDYMTKIQSQAPRARLLTKCRSGMLERVPGKIMKNK